MSTAALPPPGATLVVAALSARVMAESARQAGWRVIALDLFGDADTCRAALRWQPIGSPTAMRIGRRRLREALAAAAAEPGVAGWVAGSGFEADDALLDLAPPGLPRWGLGRAAWRALREPRHFFATLQRLGLPFPATRFEGAPPGPGWLIKQAGGSGGWHIREAGSAAPPAGAYLQQRHPGEPMSALFLADGSAARRVSLNRLLVPAQSGRPFGYQGAIGPVHDEALAATVDDALARLVPAFGLRGLMSADFLRDGDRLAWLEINPRPSASMALHAHAWPGGLMRAHLRACLGDLPATAPDHGPGLRGEAIVFADAPRRVDERLAQGLAAQAACHDLPLPGAQLGIGEPLCSVSASGVDAAGVAAALDGLQQLVLALAKVAAAGDDAFSTEVSP